MTNPMQASDSYGILQLRMGNVWSESIGDSTTYFEEGEEALMEVDNEHGPLWPLYSEYWPGRRVRKDGRTGHVRTPPYRDPASGLQLVCSVLWDDQLHRSDDIPVSVLRSYLLPAFVEDPNLVPWKILQLQKQNWTHEGLLLHLQLGHAQAQAGAQAVTTDEVQPAPSQNANGNDKGGPSNRDPRSRSRLRSQQQQQQLDAVAKQTSAAVSVQEHSLQRQQQQPTASGRSSRLAKKASADHQQQPADQDAVVSPLSEIQIADTEPQPESLGEAAVATDAATDIVAGITADVLREVRTTGADRIDSPAATPTKATSTPNNNNTFVGRLINAFVRPSPQPPTQQQQDGDEGAAPAGRPATSDTQANGRPAPLRSPMAPPASGPFTHASRSVPDVDAQEAGKSSERAAEGRQTRAASNALPLTPGESATLAARTLLNMHQDIPQHELKDTDEGPSKREPRKRGDGKQAAETDKPKLKRKVADLVDSGTLTPQPSSANGAETSKKAADDAKRAQTDVKKNKKQRASASVAPLSASRVTVDVDMGVVDRRSLLLSHVTQKASKAATPTASPAVSGQRPSGKENKALGRMKGGEMELPSTADGHKGGRQYTTRASPKQPVGAAFFSPQDAQPDYSDKKLWVKGWTGIYYPTDIARRSTEHPYDYAGEDDENPDFFYEDFLDFAAAATGWSFTTTTTAAATTLSAHHVVQYVDEAGKEWVLIKWRDWQVDVGEGPLPPKKDGEGQGHWERVDKALGVNDKRAWKDWKSGKTMPMWYKRQLANHIQSQVAHLANIHTDAEDRHR